MSDEELLLEAALKVMTDELDSLIGACLDESGKPKAPPMRDLMRARGMLPRRCKHAFPAKTDAQ
jgi:hypothetical protein